MIRFKNLLRQRGGSALVEFALVGGIFLPLCLAIFNAGLLLWTEGTLQSAAALTARCAAITSANCPNAQQFAVTQAGNWLFPGMITTANVTPAPATVCLSHASYMKVTITTNYWAAALLSPFKGKTLTVVAYFPAAPVAC